MKVIGNGAGVAGKDEIGADGGEGFEDKAAGGQARVREGELREMELPVAAVEEVEVERARGVARGRGVTSEFYFQRGHLREQFGGFKVRVDFEDGVEEGGGVGRAVNGGGFINGGNGGRVGPFVQREEKVASGAEVVEAVTEIGAEGDAGAHGEVTSRKRRIGRARGDLPGCVGRDSKRYAVFFIHALGAGVAGGRPVGEGRGIAVS